MSARCSAAVLAALLMTGCAKPGAPEPQATSRKAARTGYSAEAYPYTCRSYSEFHPFAESSTNAHQQAIAAIQSAGLPLLRALVAAGATPRLVVESETAASPVPTYALHLDVRLATGETVRLSGERHPDPGRYSGAVSALSAATGISTAELRDGHRAWHKLSEVLTRLYAAAFMQQPRLFALQVLHERFLAGERVDWYAPTRPLSASVADTEHALALVVDDLARVRAEQAAVLATLSLANHAGAHGALEAVEAELVATAVELEEWRATHHPPTPKALGVAFQEPDRGAVQQTVRQELGLVGAAVDVASERATSKLPRDLNGLGALAPPALKQSIVTDGTTAASQGEVQAVLAAITALGAPDSGAGRVAERLETAARALEPVDRAL